MTLPSDASLGIFPDNKLCIYRVKLPHLIDLNGQWEVGMCSISYAYTLYVVQQKDSAFLYTTGGRTILENADVPYGYYWNVQH